MSELKELGKILSTTLGVEDHGIMSFSLLFDFGGIGRGFGGYALDVYDEKLKRRVGTAYGMEVIMRVLDAVGVENWEDLKGKVCWAFRDEPQGNIVSIEAPAFIAHGKRFNIKEFSEQWKEAEA